MIESIDSRLAEWIPPLWRIVLWGGFSAAFSMGIYAKTSPQEKLRGLKAAQKDSRQRLMGYDGEWAGLKLLIKRDLSLSLKQLGLVTLPFFISVAPVILLMLALQGIFTAPAYVDFGPDWMRGFEFWYIVTLLAASVVIKIKFRIA